MGNHKIQFTKLKVPVIFFSLFLAIFLFSFRSLIFGMATNLVDWRDYSYLTWITNLNIGHIKSLDFANLFNTNAFFPNTNTLFLSDTLLTQSLIGLPFSFFTKNPVLIFNFVFVITFLLNCLSSYALWKKIFAKDHVAFIGSLLTIFSPFFFVQSGHFQMLSYWPFLFAIYFLLNQNSKDDFKQCFLVGVFLAVQFLASVYLAIFLLTAIAIYLFIELLGHSNLKHLVTKCAIVFLTFIILDGVFIKGYLDTKRQFNITRDYGEFVTYSANLTDYIFPQQSSLLYQIPAFQKWLSYNRHNIGESASFPGFVLLISAIMGLEVFKNFGKNRFLYFKKSSHNYFFISLAIIGFLFSFGPYINFNGIYSGIPLPYTFLLKYIPFFDTIRATSRWSFLFYIGLTYFSLSTLTKTRSKWVVILALTLLLLEVLPTNLRTYRESYLSPHDETLKSICSSKKTVLLEIPVTHFDAGNNIADGLSYITKRELASIYHKCYLINGYSGYDLPDLLDFRNQINKAIESTDETAFLTLAKKKGAEIIKINTDSVPDLGAGNYSKMYSALLRLNGVKELEPNLLLIR